MAKLVFLQRQVSQLDEPVYDRIHGLAPDSCHVVYWNDYGFVRKHADPELGLTPKLSDIHDYNYPRIWLDNRIYSVLEVYSKLLSLKPRLVVLADIPTRARSLLALGLRARGILVALRTDKNHLSNTARSGAGLAVERTLTRFTYNILAPISTLTQRYYDWPERQRCISFPYTTNEQKFSPPQAERRKERQRIRASLGIGDNNHVFLSAAKFIDRENPWELIKSYENVRMECQNASLIALGDGPLLPDIKEYCDNRGIDSIFFPGYVPFAHLQSYFFAADTFLHFAKTEPWGVSPQDALVAGLGLIASSRVGSARVLMGRRLQRFTILLEQSEQFSQRMIELCDCKDVTGMFRSARHAADKYTVSACANRWAKQ